MNDEVKVIVPKKIKWVNEYKTDTCCTLCYSIPYYVCLMFHKLQIQQIDDANKNSDIQKTIYKNTKFKTGSYCLIKATK